ncbi:two-partner secretion domain-containing protein [Scytonema sp. PRP1]|uniref:two-partner secretion domain-containing protein n=1 Tax=Scytonema sp. PRP1 TaxID=3120513 RepID=UPI00300D3729
MQLGLAGCWALVSAYVLTTSEQAHAQITPDATLSSESSVVTPNLVIRDLTSDRIDGGAIRGGNLFHSFREFNVGEARGVYFSNPEGIKNILTRVTGTSRSEILGRLGVLGNANLFLLNPNGILFGQNARLDLQGSFVGSTANSLKFADGFEYSATAPQSTSLLTLSVPVGLQYGANPGEIQVIGDGQGQRITSELIDTMNALRVEPNQTLALVGGDISLEGATIKTAGGRIELGSVAGSGFVSLASNNKGFAFGYDGVQNFGNIQLSQQTAVDASGAGSGDIQVVGRRVTLSNGSQIEASTLGTESGGSLQVMATELLNINGISSDNRFLNALTAQAKPGATGNAGSLTINTSELLIQNGAQVSTGTLGSGNGGNLTITANKVQVIGTSSDNQFSSGLFSEPLSGATGNAGSLTINTSELLIQNGALVSTGTFGSGNGGNLTITANKVQVIGTTSDGQYPSGLYSQAERRSTANAGSLTINTSELLIQNGAQVSTGTLGSGNGGNLTITANKVQLIGSSSDGQIFSNLASAAYPGSTGKAGDLTIHTSELLIQNRAQVTTGTYGSGNGGNLTLTANKVQVIGSSSDSSFGTGLFSVANPGSTGKAGDLTIHTSELLIQNGAQVSAATFGSGNGGNLALTANKVQLIGSSSDSSFGTGLFSVANPGSTGNAGDLTIHTSELLVQNGAQVTTGTFGTGNGGNLTVRANKVQLIGTSSDGRFVSSLGSAADSGSTGNGANVTIHTNELLIENGAQVNAATFGTGNGGNLTVRANKVQLIGTSSDGRFSSGLYSAAISGSTGNAGDLMINTSELLIQNGAQVSTSTLGSGNGGNLTLTANKVQLIGTSSDGHSFSGLYSAAISGSTGNGGDLTIHTSELLIQDRAVVSAEGRSQGNAGNITINVDGLLRATNGDIITTAERSSGGAITITAKDMRLFGDSNIATNVLSGVGGGGNITLNANSIIALNDSDILAFARDGRGGNITLNTPAFFGQNYQPTLSGADRLTLDRNNRVDLNATGDLSSGIITTPEPSLVQNSFIELPQNLIDTSSLIASSCIARRNQKQQGSFMITGSGGLPFRPGDAVISQYATGSVRTTDASASENSTRHAWQKGSPIVEAQNVYQLPSGQLVLSRECP